MDTTLYYPFSPKDENYIVEIVCAPHRTTCEWDWRVAAIRIGSYKTAQEALNKANQAQSRYLCVARIIRKVTA